MNYTSQDCIRDLEVVWLGTASADQQASLDFFILDLLRSTGSAGLAEILLGEAGAGLGSLVTSGTDMETLFTISNEGRAPLSIMTCADPDMLSVHVFMDSPVSSPADANPRHAAFYGIWERLIKTGDAEAACSDERERAVFLIALLESEVMNGGFGQYLTNTEGVHLDDTLECLQRIGAMQTHRYLCTAVATAAGCDSYEAAWDDESARYQELDEQFMDCGEDLAGLTAGVLMLFEDVHWNDPSTIEYLDAVIDRMQSLPILALVTYRPEFSPPWAGYGHVTTHSLNRLGRREVGGAS
jgi:hypothetical protein